MQQENPYEGRPGLSPTEAALLGEYARTAALITESLSSAERRAIDDKIALVFTLFKASVWGYVNEQAQLQAEAEADDDGHDGNDTTIS